ncbi:MBL fold metallo-hydrolase [Limosilactobacillus pontis]|uniref:MBL fold metallo-hydrolase n=1 Tax=Limosilactobacillus pontis TaxID=35787 RepID=A0ABT7UVK9_9LACO|nr:MULTISPECIES: MBL fold metallo-hydrolase [Limosilactobacillus]MDM8265726.1 MBL fold metallo-hydrolase [Limosilactobacillus pontis]
MSEKDFLRYSILASGSTGNVTYLETAHHRILIDAGLSGKRIENLMNKIDRSLKDVEAIFVTHEHGDHSHGVGVLARRYGMDVYANEGTWQAMAKRVGKIPLEQKHVLAPNKVADLGDMEIESFAVSHDAAEPQFYQVHHDNKTFCILTDTGYVSDRVAGTIRNADAYLMECNHDTEMLRMGPYSWPLKQRILGDEGHLSNEEGADALMDVIGPRTKEIFLGHRSQHNNMRSLAHLTVASMMEQHDFGVDHDFKLADAEPATPSQLITL